MPELAFVDGRITEIGAAVVPVEDRGYQFGDAVYEFVAAVNGKYFRMSAHLERLRRSLRALDFPPVSQEMIREAAGRLLDDSEMSRAGLYIQISRGTAPRNHPFPEGARPAIVMTIREVAEKPARLMREGAAVITVPDQRWGRCDIKTVQLLANVLAKQKALAAGCDDALFVGDDDVVREATSANLFLVRDGRLFTHPATHRILHGITRAAVLEICGETGIEPVEEGVAPGDLPHCQEAFLTGTTTEVLAVTRIDGHVVGKGGWGPVTRRLKAELASRITAECPPQT